MSFDVKRALVWRKRHYLRCQRMDELVRVQWTGFPLDLKQRWQKSHSESDARECEESTWRLSNSSTANENFRNERQSSIFVSALHYPVENRSRKEIVNDRASNSETSPAYLRTSGLKYRHTKAANNRNIDRLELIISGNTPRLANEATQDVASRHLKSPHDRSRSSEAFQATSQSMEIVH